jgi:DME family drug/metabolite transporter
MSARRPAPPPGPPAGPPVGTAPGTARAAAAALGAAVLFGTTGTAQALGPTGTSAVGVAGVRLIVGALGLWVLGRRHRVPIDGRRRRMLVVVGAIGVAAYQALFFAAVRRTGVGTGTIVAVGSGPLVAGALHAVLTRRPPGRAWLLATLVAAAGATLLVAAGTDVRIDPVGVAVALAAGAGYATYAVAGGALVADGVPSTQAMFLVHAGGAVLVAPALVSQPLGWLTTGEGLLLALHLGLVATTTAYVLFGLALRRLSAPLVTTLTLAEPVTATALGIVVLDETLTAAGGIGAVLVLGALVVAARPGRPGHR